MDSVHKVMRGACYYGTVRLLVRGSGSCSSTSKYTGFRIVMGVKDASQ